MLTFSRCGSGNLKDRKITQHASYLILHGSVTARIGLYVESDLSMNFQEILQTNLLGLFGFAGNTKIDPILREIRF
jgi:hypothetical protein